MVNAVGFFHFQSQEPSPKFPAHLSAFFLIPPERFPLKVRNGS